MVQANKRRRKACMGDIVTVDLDMTPENGYVPDTLFDTKGVLTFVLGWGNYLPGLHALVEGMAVGDEVMDSIDAGWGERRSDLVVTLPKSRVNALGDLDTLREGQQVTLASLEVVVTRITQDAITVDANPPLAGASFLCRATILHIDPMPTHAYHHHHKENDSPFGIATFALSCFWSAELAFMRQVGVVGTRVGFTQGITKNPTYEEVCSGETQHREAVMVVYDSRLVSYETLMRVALERLAITSPRQTMNLFGDDDEQQHHGFYVHNDEQMQQARRMLLHNRFDVELKPATTFYDAEEHHQQYLLKGGQSARKGAKETIRCFG